MNSHSVGTSPKAGSTKNHPPSARVFSERGLSMVGRGRGSGTDLSFHSPAVAIWAKGFAALLKWAKSAFAPA